MFTFIFVYDVHVYSKSMFLTLSMIVQAFCLTRMIYLPIGSFFLSNFQLGITISMSHEQEPLGTGI